MKVGVIGAGAMGSLIGGLLARAGEEVWLIDVWEDHISTIKREGLTIIEKDRELNIPVNATLDPIEVGPVELGIVMVKSYHTRDAAVTALSLKDENSLFITLQNGLGNIEILMEVLGEDSVIAGSTSQGATLLSPGKILHAGAGKTFIGELNGRKSKRTMKVAEVFNNAGIETEVTEDIMHILWTKLLVNVGINALTAVTGIKNGEILDYPEAEEILEDAVSEAMMIAKHKGIEFGSEIVDKVKEICRLTAPNRSSMGQDIDNQRRTEIEAINGIIVREGGRMGINVPVNKTLYRLIKVIEGRYL